jgi:hypothetical protein
VVEEVTCLFADYFDFEAESAEEEFQNKFGSLEASLRL